MVLIALSFVITLVQGQWGYVALTGAMLVVGGLRLSRWRRP
jgi:hypothetical protein